MIGDVASDYIQIRTLQAQIAIARDNVVKQKAALDIARDRFKGGATSELDVFQAENVLGQTEAAIPQLTAQLQQAENALAVLLGMPPASIDGAARRFARASPRRRATSRSASPPICSGGVPTCARPSSRPRRRARKVGIAAADLYPAFSLGGALGTLVSTTNGNNDRASSSPRRASPSPSARRSAGRCSTTGRSPTRCAPQDAELQALLIDYQNIVLKAQQEVENGLAGFVAGAPAGRLSARQRDGRQQRADHRHRPVPARLARLHHRADRRAEPLSGAEQSRRRRGRRVGRASIAAYRALGGGWQIREGHEFVERRHARGDARPHQLRRHPAAGRPAAAAGARPSRPADVGPTVRPRNGDRREDQPELTQIGQARLVVGTARRARCAGWSGPARAEGELERLWATSGAAASRPRPSGAKRRRRRAGRATPLRSRCRPRRRPIPVVLPKVQAFSDTLVVTGNAAAVNAVKLVARVPGYLEQIHFQDGQIVKKGDLLVHHPAGPVQGPAPAGRGAAPGGDRSRATTPRLEVGRYTALLKQHAASQVEVDHWVFEEKTRRGEHPGGPGAGGARQAQPRLHRGPGAVRRPDGPAPHRPEEHGRRRRRAAGARRDHAARPDLRRRQHQLAAGAADPRTTSISGG